MILRADARHLPLPPSSVQCVVTSPPYWGLRKYAGEQELVWDSQRLSCAEPKACEHEWTDQTDDSEGYTSQKRWQHGASRNSNPTGWSKEVRHHGSCRLCGAWRGAYGLEPTIEMYVTHTVEVLREVRRVLRTDGVMFLNLGDSYASGGNGWRPGRNRAEGEELNEKRNRNGAPISPGLKPKDLCLIPARVALAAQADGWWVRSDIIWAKPNPMPESVRDRPTDAYEHILMLMKSARYYWDAEAVKEAQTESSRQRSQYGWAGRTDDMSNGARTGSSFRRMAETGEPIATIPSDGKRNIRNVWTFPTQPYKGAHFATFPEELVIRCLQAATRPGDLVMDPFGGSGTVGEVAFNMGRRFLLLDLAYHDLQQSRVPPLADLLVY